MPALVKTLLTAIEKGRPVVAIDGCVLACVRSSLACHDVEPTVSHELQHYQVKKVKHGEFDPDQAAEVTEIVKASLPPSTCENTVADRDDHGTLAPRRATDHSGGMQ